MLILNRWLIVISLSLLVILGFYSSFISAGEKLARVVYIPDKANRYWQNKNESIEYNDFVDLGLMVTLHFKSAVYFIPSCELFKVDLRALEADLSICEDVENILHVDFFSEDECFDNKVLLVTKYGQQVIEIDRSVNEKLLIILDQEDSLPRVFSSNNNFTGIEGVIRSIHLYQAGYSWSEIKRMWVDDFLNRDLYYYAMGRSGKYGDEKRQKELIKLTQFGASYLALCPLYSLLEDDVKYVFEWFKSRDVVCQRLMPSHWFSVLNILESPGPETIEIILKRKFGRFDSSPQVVISRKRESEKDNAIDTLSSEEEDMPSDPNLQNLEEGLRKLSLAKVKYHDEYKVIKSPLLPKCQKLLKQRTTGLNGSINPGYYDDFPAILKHYYEPKVYIAGSGEGQVFLCESLRGGKSSRDSVVALKVYGKGRVMESIGDSLSQIDLLQSHGLCQSMVSIIEHGWVDGKYYQVFEYLPFSLDDFYINGKLDVKVYKFVAYQLFQSVKFFHQRGIAHRDIKPMNMRFDKHGILKVIDLGGMRYFTKGSVVNDGFMGTPGFSPVKKDNPFYMDLWGEAISLLVLRLGSSIEEISKELSNEFMGEFDKDLVYYLALINQGTTLDGKEQYKKLIDFLFRIKAIKPFTGELDFFCLLLSDNFYDSRNDFSQEPRFIIEIMEELIKQEVIARME
ncbi:hypothetical protein [Endozoicomonas sp. Mp262]|uniref:protein kinase domain-containing protein n=1 Tax=Endozoicomonas sp. Mp262 TaxID=2919499 RepID=UPI0021D9D923